MKKKYPECRYVIGDIRDAQSLEGRFKGNDVVFHVAALKHVDILEDYPMESIKTNILATDAMARLALKEGIKHFAFSSTDKAVDPINSYGYSKALSEKILHTFNREQKQTLFSVYRWGNVLGSQGSAIHFFIKTLKEQRAVFITDSEMTRFWIPIEWAVRYLLRTYTEAHRDRAMVPPVMKAASVSRICDAIAALLDLDAYTLNDVGIRPGEKIHEVMFSQHSTLHASSETAEQYTFDELKEMLEPIVKSYST